MPYPSQYDLRYPYPWIPYAHYPYPGSFYHNTYRPFSYPQADTQLFHQSLGGLQSLMKQGSKIIDQLAQSPDLSVKLMTAAQEGKQAEVDRLVHSLGADAKVTTSYTPTGIQFTLHANTSDGYLTLHARWGRDAIYE